MATNNRVVNAYMRDVRWNWLYRTGGMAAVLAGVFFLIGVVQLLVVGGGLTLLQDNWLIIIFKVHAGMGGNQIDKLQVFNTVDLVILALVAVMYLGLYLALHTTSKIWSIIALIQPFLGIGLFIGTGSAGRSAVMGAGLVISAVMLRGNRFSKVIGWIGLVACTLLFAGDLSAGAIPPSAILASLFVIGYVLLIAWLFLVSRRLFQIGGAQ
jgi:hypothetical protein